MTRLTLPSHPLLLGFDDFERLIERTTKSNGDGYPPYNIERLSEAAANAGPEVLRITLAVAGFTRAQLEIQVEDNQLLVRGKQMDDASRHYLHRGIAARQFCRTFVLAEGLEVRCADLDNGLLSIDLVRLAPARFTRTIAIGGKNSKA
jgi:HSP20 family molecular chaperone IbpA